jgi:hypothetical protein
VAFFVLQLFLPIVVFVFQLWWMLALRFCLPPDVDIDSGLIDDFEALGAGLEVDATVAATVANRPAFVANMAELLGGSMPNGTPLDQEMRAAFQAGRIDASSYAAIGRAALAQDAREQPRRVFAARVERAEVVTP